MRGDPVAAIHPAAVAWAAQGPDGNPRTFASSGERPRKDLVCLRFEKVRSDRFAITISLTVSQLMVGRCLVQSVLRALRLAAR